MNVRNGIYKDVKIKWKSISLPLKAGTPISMGGTEANGSEAIGIVPQNIAVKPETPYIGILIGGDVDLAECEAMYGSALQESALRAMSGITFYGPDGTPVIDYQIDPVTEATETMAGVVKRAVNVPEAEGEAPTAAEFKALLDALIDAGIMSEPAE